MFKKLFLITLLLTVTLFASTGEFSDRGSKWYGMELHFSSLRAFGGEGSMNTLKLNSITRFYPANNFILGPSFTYSRLSFGEWGDRESYSIFNIGMDIGFSNNIKNKAIPYFILNPKLSMYTAGYSGDVEGEPYFKVEAKAGCIILINEYVGVQIEPNYQMEPSYEMYSFGLNVGFTFTLNKRLFSLGASSRSPLDEIMLW